MAGTVLAGVLAWPQAPHARFLQSAGIGSTGAGRRHGRRCHRLGPFRKRSAGRDRDRADGRITDVGTRAAVPIPKGARVIDCTGKFIIPGLVDGFAGMN